MCSRSGLEEVEVDLVGDGLGGGCVGLASGVVVGAAAFAFAGGAAAGSGGGEVGGFAQLGGQVAQSCPQVLWGERTRGVESRAALRARVKLTREGSRPGGAAWVIKWRSAW